MDGSMARTLKHLPVLLTTVEYHKALWGSGRVSRGLLPAKCPLGQVLLHEKTVSLDWGLGSPLFHVP